MLDTSLYVCPAEKVTAQSVKDFLAQQAIERLFLESGTLEFKRQNSNSNVVRAICGMANLNGGLVFLGVDEKSPTKAPGVEASSYGDVISQCRSSLQPLFFPEIIPVPADDPAKVVLVIRVPALPHMQPIFCSGAVYVRTPGSTIRANRDHVISMVHAQQTSPVALPGRPAMHAVNTFHPEPPSRPADEGTEHPALRIRGASNVALGGAPTRVLLRESMRRAIEGAIDGSDLATWGTGTADYSNPPWQVTVLRSDEWVQSRQLPRRFEPKPVFISVSVKAGPQRISWAVDIDIPSVEHAAGGGTALELSAAVQAWHLMATLVGRDIPRAIVDTVARPPQSESEAALWLVSGTNDVRSTLGLGDRPTAVDVRARGIWQLLLAHDDLDEIGRSLAEWLEMELLDEALLGAEQLAHEAVRTAMASPPNAIW